MVTFGDGPEIYRRDSNPSSNRGWPIIRNVTHIHGDGFEGCKRNAPYDAIIMTASPNEIPSNLTAEQILIRSGNIGSVRIAQKIGPEKYKSFLEKIGVLSEKKSREYSYYGQSVNNDEKMAREIYRRKGVPTRSRGGNRDREDAIETIPLNYYRLIKNEPLLFEIDQKRGY